MVLDKKSTRSINIKFPLERSSEGSFAMNEETIAAVADDLKVLILTNYGERPMLYDFGCNLRPLLFDAMGQEFKQKVSDSVTFAVSKWMPYVRILSIDVLLSDDASLQDNECKINVKFSVGNTDLKNEMAVVLRK